MSEAFNTFLKETYQHFKNDPNPPIPLNLIEEYFQVEGIELNKQEKNEVQA